MKILKLFHGRKKEEKEKVGVVVRQPPPELKLICGDDDEVYKALEETLLLNILSLPSKEFSMEEALERARAGEEAARTEKEETEDLFRVGLEYRMAGQIALFKGDIEGVKRFFGKAQKLTGRNYLILAVAERAIEKAQEYYELLKTKSE